MRKTLMLGIAGILLALVLAGLGMLQAAVMPVTLIVEGQPTHLRTASRTVDGLLRSRGITLGEHDVVAPAAGTPLRAGSEVNVRYGRKVNLTVDGEQREVWTTAADVDGLLRQLRLSDANAKTSLSRSTPIARVGMEVGVEIAQEVTVRSAAGEVRTRAHGTVADAVRKAGVNLAPTDRVEPPLDTPLKAAAVITVVQVRDVEVTRTVPVKFKVTKKEDAGKPKGYQRVEQKGVDGVLTEVWVERQENGVKVSETKKSSTETKPAVEEIQVVGTDRGGAAVIADVPAPAASGSRNDLMAAAGISAGDFGYVEKLIAKESGWNPNARNKSSGACGLVQALPCSKLGPNWNNPVVALKWGDNYVKQRYGSWSGAWAHSQANGWY